MKKWILLSLLFPAVASAQNWPSFFTWNRLWWGMTSEQVAAVYPLIRLQKGYDTVVIPNANLAGLGNDVQVVFDFDSVLVSKIDVPRSKQAPISKLPVLDSVSFTFSTIKPLSRNINDYNKRPQPTPLNYYPAYVALVKAYGEPTITDQKRSATMIPSRDGDKLSAISTSYEWTWEKTNVNVRYSVYMSFDIQGQGGKFVTNKVNRDGSWSLLISKPANFPSAPSKAQKKPAL